MRTALMALLVGLCWATLPTRADVVDWLYQVEVPVIINVCKFRITDEGTGVKIRIKLMPDPVRGLIPGKYLPTLCMLATFKCSNIRQLIIIQIDNINRGNSTDPRIRNDDLKILSTDYRTADYCTENKDYTPEPVHIHKT